MHTKIAIASGKGGTGKTTVSVNLLRYFQQAGDGRVLLVDCDVEEPNDLLFWGEVTKSSEEVINQLIPEINKDKCTYCGKCVEYCEFNAISVISSHQYAKVDGDLCHSCGACIVACEYDAIVEQPEPIGQVCFYKSKEEYPIAEGRLKVGSPMQTLLIKELKKRVEADDGLVIFDAPPGTSCPVVETISDVDYVVLVAEPTLFGLHDLKLMVDLVRELNRPFGLVINKAGLGDDNIYRYAKDENIDILGEIPFSKEYAGRYAKGEILNNVPQDIDQAYRDIVRNLGDFRYAPIRSSELMR